MLGTCPLPQIWTGRSIFLLFLLSIILTISFNLWLWFCPGARSWEILDFYRTWLLCLAFISPNRYLIWYRNDLKMYPTFVWYYSKTLCFVTCDNINMFTYMSNCRKVHDYKIKEWSELLDTLASLQDGKSTISMKVVFCFKPWVDRYARIEDWHVNKLLRKRIA